MADLGVPHSRLYAAFQQIDATMDTGVHFAAEYTEAMEMQGQ